jgi:hypothetical protein
MSSLPTRTPVAATAATAATAAAAATTANGRSALPATRAVPRSVDVAVFAVACMAVGALALAGTAVVSTAAERPELAWRVAGVGALLLAVGAGLLARQHWARNAAVGMLAYGVITQLGIGWLQSALLQTLVDAVTGRAAPQVAAATLELAPVQPLGTAGTLLVCAAMGWFIVRLAGAPVRAEFSACRRQRTATALLRRRAQNG